MERYNELILLILRYACEHADGQRPVREPAFEAYSRNQVRYHIELCRQAGLLTTVKSGKRQKILALTWNGHERLAQERDD
jgi:hypothetical protein